MLDEAGDVVVPDVLRGDVDGFVWVAGFDECGLAVDGVVGCDECADGVEYASH